MKNLYRLIFSISLIMVLGGCFSLEDPDTGVLLDDIITVSIDDEEILADGKDRTKVIATLQKGTDLDQSILFQTDHGTFAGTGGKSEISVKASGKIAEAILISNKTPNEQVTVSAKIGDYIVTSFLTFTKVEPELIPIEDIILLQIDDPTILADGNERTRIQATLGPESEPNSIITFSTDQGFFAGTNNQKSFTAKAAGRLLEVFLVSDLKVNSSVTISAKVRDYVTSELISFERAYPDDLVIEADKLKLVSDGQDIITLTVKLYKDSGNPSELTRINFSQAIEGDDVGQEITIQNIVFSSNGILTVPVKSLADTTGRIQILAEVDGKTDVNDSIIIELTQ